jgi:hypothetical protein
MFVQKQYEAAYQTGQRWAEQMFADWSSNEIDPPAHWPFTKAQAAELYLEAREASPEEAARQAAIIHAAAQLRWQNLVSRRSGVVKCADKVDRESPTAPAVPAARRSTRPRF